MKKLSIVNIVIITLTVLTLTGLCQCSVSTKETPMETPMETQKETHLTRVELVRVAYINEDKNLIVYGNAEEFFDGTYCCDRYIGEWLLIVVEDGKVIEKKAVENIDELIELDKYYNKYKP